MTRRYNSINQHDARYNLVRDYPGGIETLAVRMDMSPNVLRNKTAPGIGTHHVTDEEDSRIIEFCVGAKVDEPHRALIAKNFRHGLMAFPVPDVGSLNDEELTQSLCRAIKEFSDVGAAVSKALRNDNRIDAVELEEIEKEAREALVAIAELRERARLFAEK